MIIIKFVLSGLFFLLLVVTAIPILVLIVVLPSPHCYTFGNWVTDTGDKIDKWIKEL